MAELRQSRRATEDFRSLFRYGIGRWGHLAAFDYLVSFDKPLDLLLHQPRAGRLRPDVGRRLRSLVHRSHVIFYRAQADEVLIVRVLHHARDAAGALGRGIKGEIVEGR